ncbi:MAG: hypothetical protein ABI559_02720 [Chloroflexota bacterium]
MARAPALIVFLGGFGTSDVESLVDDARLMTTLDAISFWSGGVPDGRVIVASDMPLAVELKHNVTVDVDFGEYHFGRRLAGVLRKYDVEAAVYMGAGSVPLFGAEELAGVVAQLTDRVGVTNNFYSSDMSVFPVNDAVLAAIEPLVRDNSLARALKEVGGLEMIALSRTVTTQFDIDTPTDVAILAVTGEGGPSLREWIGSRGISIERYQAVLPLFLEQKNQVVVAGRVGTQAWSYLERETACRVRLFAEERGMEADGRVAPGKVRSLLGYYLDAVGFDRFFETLGELGDAAFIDTRVLLAHKQIDASREDRFLSDLGRPEDIRDDFLRDFTRAALAAPMPVLLGGHSLMAGGLMALNEYAWRTLGDS